MSAATLMGCNASTGAPPGTTPVEPEVDELLKNFCKFEADMAKYTTEDCMMNPPGAPPMPVEMMAGMMAGKPTYSHIHSKVHGRLLYMHLYYMLQL